MSPNNGLRGAVSGMWFGRTAARNVAHLSAHLFVLASRRRRAAKVIAQLMGHANVDTTLNVYTQVLDGATRAAVEKIGDRLFTIRAEWKR